MLIMAVGPALASLLTKPCDISAKVSASSVGLSAWRQRLDGMTLIPILFLIPCNTCSLSN